MAWEPRNTTFNDAVILFQTLDWYCDDIQNENTNYFEYKIFVFGINNTGIPITLCINNFFPFFFIEVPSNWDQSCVYSVKNALNAKSIKNISFLEGKRYYGFENNKIRKFLKLSFYSSKAFRSVRYQIQNNKYTISGKDYLFDLYESNIDPLLRLIHLRDILTAGWIKVDNFTFNETENYHECNWTALNPYSEADCKISDIRILYFDIEACSEDGSFPNALKKNDRATQICCITKDTVSLKVKKYLFNLGTCDAVEDTIVMQFPSEKKLLLSYAKFIREIDPDIIVGYNIFGFDNGYLFERAKVLGIEEQFNYQSKINKRTDIIVKKLDNQQSGFNDWKMTKLIGRTHIDLLQVIKKILN